MDATASHILFFSVAVIVGALVNICGLGGVLIVPASIKILKLDATTAIVSALASFVVSAAVNMVWKTRQNSVPLKVVVPIFLGSSVGSILSQLALRSTGTLMPMILVSLLATMSGLEIVANFARGWLYPTETVEGAERDAECDAECDGRQKGDRVDDQDALPYTSGFFQYGATEALILGLGTGFFSGLTGTGGPIFLLPVLFKRAPKDASIHMLVAIAFSAAAALSMNSTVTNILLGQDFSLAVVFLGLAGNLCGMPAGNFVGDRLKTIDGGVDILKNVVGLVLLVVGVNLFVDVIQ
jgi:uncharacterized membrane protein YfcA